MCSQSINDITYSVIGKCFEVYNTLGNGFLEIVYKDALEIEFQQANMGYEREKSFPVFYKNINLERSFNVDFTVENILLVEVKSVSKLREEHVAQTINYLKSSGIKLGLLINFGSHGLEKRRLIL